MGKVKQTGCILLSAITLLFSGCSQSTQTDEASHPFDFYIDLTTQDDIEDLSDESSVEGVFPFTLMTFQRTGHNNPQSGQIAILASPSFDTLEYSPFNLTYMTDTNRAVMQDQSKNPILIDAALAKAEKLKVGDAFTQETKASDEPMEFTVAGIFRHSPLFAQYEAVALINEQITHIFSDRVEEMGYTNAYVKASDLTALKTYLDEEFIPHLPLKDLSEEEIAV